MSDLTPEVITEYLQKQLTFKQLPPLTLQEETIIKYTINQKTYEQVAAYLYINPGTVRNIASQLFQKLSILFDRKISKKNFFLPLAKLSIARSSTIKSIKPSMSQR